jgi:hypothetical protein
MLAREELPVELCLLLFGPQAQYPPGDYLDLLHPAMGRPAQHHDVGQLVVPLRCAACDVVDLAIGPPAAVQQVAQLAREHILGVLGQQSRVSNRHYFSS